MGADTRMSINRRTFLAALPCAGISLGLAPGEARAQALTGTGRASAIAALTQAANSVRGLQGRFVQTNPDRTTSQGAFWLLRPGKVRFEYDAPSPLLLVSDGQNVAVQDRRLRTTDRYPLRATPLYFLLKANVDLERDVIVGQVERRGGLLVASVRDRRREADGELTLAFNEVSKALEEWAIRDRRGQTTRVRLVGAQSAARIDPGLFVAPGGTRRYDPSGGR
jgi:outer membrane lipoprotein-sorting protein